MAGRTELLVLGCREEDLEILRRAAGPGGAILRKVSTPIEVAHRAACHHPVALVLGVGQETVDRLDVIPMVRAVCSELPVIVIGDEDSLEIERRARQRCIFYYLVHPIDEGEASALLTDLMRQGGH